MSIVFKLPTSASDCLAQIDLDLSLVRSKMANPEKGEAWSVEKLDLAEFEYRKFLALCITYPERASVPCQGAR